MQPQHSEIVLAAEPTPQSKAAHLRHSGIMNGIIYIVSMPFVALSLTPSYLRLDVANRLLSHEDKAQYFQQGKYASYVRQHQAEFKELDRWKHAFSSKKIEQLKEIRKPLVEMLEKDKIPFMSLWEHQRGYMQALVPIALVGGIWGLAEAARDLGKAQVLETLPPPQPKTTRVNINLTLEEKEKLNAPKPKPMESAASESGIAAAPSR